MDSVEERFVLPFYLKMMGLNACRHATELWGDLVFAGREAGLADVKQLLAPDHWRPAVMGSWFSLRFEQQQIAPELLGAISRSRGSLTAPPLAVAASLVVGEEAVPTLVDYVQRDIHRQYGSATFVAAVVEHLGHDAAIPPEDGDRRALARMLQIARHLRNAFTT